MSSVNRVLQQSEVLEARAASESSPGLGLEAAALLEELAREQPEHRFSLGTKALSLRLRFAPGADETAAAFQRLATAIETGPHPNGAALKLARRALLGALEEHWSHVTASMRAWCGSADVIVRPEDVSDAR